LDFRKKSENLSTSTQLANLHSAFRNVIPFLESDREMYPDIAAAEKFIRGFDFAKI
jgi:histidine ammonia-lyase